MKTVSSYSLRRHLVKERESGSPTAILFSQICLFATSLCAHEMTFISKHNVGGFAVALSYHIVALLLPCFKLLSENKFLRKDCGLKVYFFSNCTSLLLAIILESVYEKSLASLGVVLSTTVLVLLLMTIIRPRNDLGYVGFFIGVTGSIVSSQYKLGYQTWVVFAICCVLLGFTAWLAQNWLDVEVTEEDPLGMSKSILQVLLACEAVTVAVFFLYWDQYLFRTSTSSKSFLGLVVCLAILCLWFTRATLRHLILGLRWHSQSPSKNNTEMKDLEKNEGSIDEEIIPKERPPSATDTTLRQRPKQSSKGSPSFTKILSENDTKKQLAVPSDFMEHLPEPSRGVTVYFPVRDESSGKVWEFGYYTRRERYPKPVFRGRWKEFCRQKGLKSGDRITFYADGGGSYRIAACRINKPYNRNLGVPRNAQRNESLACIYTSTRLGLTTYVRQGKRSKRPSKNNVEIKDKQKGNIEEITYTLRQRHKRRKGTFTKTLSDTDIKKHLVVPSEFKKAGPNSATKMTSKLVIELPSMLTEVVLTVSV